MSCSTLVSADTNSDEDLALLTPVASSSLPLVISESPLGSSITVEKDVETRFSVVVSDLDGDLKQIRWFVNSELVEQKTLSGFESVESYTLKFNASGINVVGVLVADKAGRLSPNPVEWQVNVVATNLSPTISAQTPNTKPIRINRGETFSFAAIAEDTDSNLQGIDWYVDDVKVATSLHSGNTALANFDWMSSTTGTYVITANAFDDHFQYDGEGIAWRVHVVDGGNFPRGVYVGDTSTIMLDRTLQTQLLQKATWNGFDQLALYQMRKTLSDSPEQLAAFIERAKTEYGLEIAAVAGSPAEMDSISEFMDNYPLSFSALRMEYEFWNNDDYSGFVKRLTHMRQVADAHDMGVEVYLGHFGEGDDTLGQRQAKEIAELTDRIQLHAYRKEPFDAYDNIKRRLDWFQNSEVPVTLDVIFSVEDERTDDLTSTGFMYDWVKDNSLKKAEKIFTDAYQLDIKNIQNSVSFGGFQYFKYFYLHDIWATR